MPAKVLSAENSSVRISCRKKNCYTKNKLICLIPSLKYLKVLEHNKIAYWSIIITYFFLFLRTVLPSSIIVQYSRRVNLVFTLSLRTSLPNHEDNGLEEDSSPSQLFFGMSRDAHPKGNGNVAWHPKERLRERLEKQRKSNLEECVTWVTSFTAQWAFLVHEFRKKITIAFFSQSGAVRVLVNAWRILKRGLWKNMIHLNEKMEAYPGNIWLSWQEKCEVSNLLIWYNPIDRQRLQVRLQYFIMYSALTWQSPLAAQALQDLCLSLHGAGISYKINKKKIKQRKYEFSFVLTIYNPADNKTLIV